MAKLNSSGNKVAMKDVNTDGFEFKKISEFIGKEVPVKGYFFTKGKFGEQIVVITTDCLINMPGRSADEFRTVFSNPDNMASLMDGKIKLTNIEYCDTKSGTKTVAYDIED